MASSQFLLILSLIATCTLCALSYGRFSNRREAEQDFQDYKLKVWTGQTVKMKCGDTMNGSQSRFWRNDLEVLAVANMITTNDERFSIYNDSVELILKNIALEDAGTYVCSVNTRPLYRRIYQLEVIESMCNLPESPQNGGIKILNMKSSLAYDSDNKVSYGSNGTFFRSGARILYYCNTGYAIFGNEIRTCINPYTDGWTGEAPKCDQYVSVADLGSSVASLGTSVADLRGRIDSQTDKEYIAKLNLTMTNLKDRITKLEGVADASSKNLERIVGLDAEIHRLQAAHNSGLHPAASEETMGHLVAQLGAKDGHIISEFAWTISDIYEKIEKSRSKKLAFVKSSPFYTNTPGYKMQLRFYPVDGGSENFGMYAVLLQGEFDEIVTWPFASSYQLSIISRNENEVTAYTVVNSGPLVCNGAFLKPPPNNSNGCGTNTFMSHDDFTKNKKLYLFGKDILVKITIHLA